MPRRPPYWTTEKPSDAKRWSGMQSGAVLDPDVYCGRLFHLYRRYVKQWNDIELDHSRGLDEHTHEVCGAKVIGARNMFVLSHVTPGGSRWILEVVFGKGFRQFYPGWSTGMNAMRTTSDIKRMLLHWADTGRSAFEKWLEQEEQTKATREEWTEYRV